MRIQLATFLITALCASCATPPVSVPEENPAPIRISIADIESKENLGGPALADSVREHLQDRLMAHRRFEIVERQNLAAAQREMPDASLAKAGRIAGADWVVYGVITQEHRGAVVHLRVIRADTGTLIYSGGRLVAMTAAGSSSPGARSAVEELVREISVLPR